MQNIEIKTPLDSVAAIETRLVEIRAEKIWARHQTDTFYAVPRGWLKLREADQAQPELISYLRATDYAGPRPSTYDLAPLEDAVLWKRLLGRVLDADCVVNKTRTLWIWRHTRIHLDVVQSLGEFLELETVMNKITVEIAKQEADQIIELLQLDRNRFISIPYREMLREKLRNPHSELRKFRIPHSATTRSIR